MLRSQIQSHISSCISLLIEAGELRQADYPEVEVQDSKSPEHGDYASNVAMVCAKLAGLPPRAIAEVVVRGLSNEPFFESVEIAGPGFLNFRLSMAAYGAGVASILELQDKLAHTESKAPLKINVEFVSVNPNGPITVGSGRGAAFGDTLARVLEASGHTVHREFYVNDGVNSEQMRLFANSVQAAMECKPTPENGYKGEYVQDIASTILTSHGDARPEVVRTESERLMIERQKSDMASAGVIYDTWFSEQTLHDSGAVKKSIDRLKEMGVADDEPYQTVVVRKKGEPDQVTRVEQPTEDLDEFEEGAAGSSTEKAGKTLWLRSTRFGDDKDRVLIRANGRPTYIASDLAYHQSKFDRGFDKLIDIWGPDHHGYIGRMNAVIQAMGYSLDRFEIIIFQIVRFVKDGKPAPMRKRDGNIYELRDLYMELGKTAAPKASEEEQRRIGVDVARFFYLMRSHESHMDFDIDLATKQSDDNPVFYAQYAHARIFSLIRKAEDAGFVLSESSKPDVRHELLSDPREKALIKKILDLPYETARCAQDYGVHRLTTYAVDLARSYHHFYDGCRVILPENPELTKARLALCEATRIGLRGVFSLLGISAPEQMHREAV